jgi:hypothetical protein
MHVAQYNAAVAYAETRVDLAHERLAFDPCIKVLEDGVQPRPLQALGLESLEAMHADSRCFPVLMDLPCNRIPLCIRFDLASLAEPERRLDMQSH